MKLHWAGHGFRGIYIDIPYTVIGELYESLNLLRKHKPTRSLISENLEGIKYIDGNCRGYGAWCNWDRWVHISDLGIFHDRVECAMTLAHEATHARQIARWSGCSYTGTNREQWERDAMEQAIPALKISEASDSTFEWYTQGCLVTRWWE